MTSGFARRERSALADSLLAAGPDAPTLCEGWSTRDLAAHIVLRERRPLAAAGILIKPLAARTARVQDRLAAGDYTDLVQALRNPPAWSPISNPLTHELGNQSELFIHHEDVRRAAPDWTPRALDPGHSKALWGQVPRTAALALRRFPGTVVVSAPGYGEKRVKGSGPEVVLRGEPGELLLFLSGRQRVADVSIDGPEELVQKLRKARLGL